MTDQGIGGDPYGTVKKATPTTLPAMSLRRLPFPTWILAGAAALPLFVWWLGWHPGFASPDTIDQWAQARTGNISNHHPAIHTLYLGWFSLGTTNPGLVTLFQILVFAGLLIYAAKRLVEAGVPTWLAVGAAWLLGLSPAVAPTTLALWKDVVFGLFLLWAWIELLAIANDQTRVERWPTVVRLGVALAGVWLFRGNGPITVVLVVLVLCFVYRRHLRTLAIAVATLASVVFLVVGPLYSLFEVRRQSIEVAQVFIPDLAAVFVGGPERFDVDQTAMIEALAPAAVWTESYDCYDSTELLFHPQFTHAPIQDDPGGYLTLQIGAFLRNPVDVARHRVCAANFIFVPAQPADAYFHRPPFDIPDNTLGLARDPISDFAYRGTLKVWQWAEMEDRLWLTWRPAVVILPTLAAIVVFALRPSGRRFLIPSTLFLAHLVNVVVTSPTQEFRFAYPLYLTGVLTLTLLVPTLRDRGHDPGT